MGILTIGLWTVVLSTIFWYALKSVLGLRVTEEEELIGLDIGEHGMEAYSGFLKEAGGMAGSSVSTTAGSTEATTHY
jgi:ammonium transporter, Amt family